MEGDPVHALARTLDAVRPDEEEHAGLELDDLRVLRVAWERGERIVVAGQQ